MRRMVSTASPEETERLGRWIGARLERGDALGIVGELGSGKTCLTRGIAEGLGVEPSVVSSPTFVFIHEYPLPGDDHDKPVALFHVDLYRLHTSQEFEDLGGDEAFSDRSVCVVEWADRAADAMPVDALWLDMAPRGETRREITFDGDGDRYPWIAALGAPASDGDTKTTALGE